MCQVPEVLMCYHLDGIVQRYEIIKTEDLPKVSDQGSFSPQVVRRVARCILSFLQSNAAKEGHTYWLFKGKDDDVIKLYDLTCLCQEAKQANQGESQGRAEDEDEASDNDREENQNPFRTAVSMLLYKAARNMLQSPEQRANEGKTVQKLLVKCLSLLDEVKFPHIATSAHFMLADLFVPDDVNPADFGAPEDVANGSTDSLKDNAAKTVDGDETDSADLNGAKEIKLSMLCRPPTTENDANSSSSSSPCPGDRPRSAHLTLNGRQRCTAALQHIVKGLTLLTSLEMRREHEEAREQKLKEQRERDNPRMASPGQPIPMPYIQASDEEAAKRQVDMYRGPMATRRELAESQKWHDHLRDLLMQKAFMVYVTLAEVDFGGGHYGASLRSIKRALNCLEGSSAKEGASMRLLDFALGVAGDSYMAMVRNWSRLPEFQEEYNGAADVDLDMAEYIEHITEWREATIKIPTDIEEALILCRTFLTQAATTWDASHSDRRSIPTDGGDDHLSQRLGNVCNELGVFYMNQASALVQEKPDEKSEVPKETVDDILRQSLNYLQEGLGHFDKAGDNANRALLYSNSGRVYRLLAFTSSQLGEKEAEMKNFRSACDQYESALTILRGKKHNPAVWESVAWEYSSTLFTLGIQMQDPSLAATVTGGALSKADRHRQVNAYCQNSLIK
jgi:tetratricopeptide (TPR) repeat protein